MVDLGWLYYAYMAAIAIFCPNSINILAGINGIEVSQSLVISLLLLLNDILSLYAARRGPDPHPATDPHLFSIYLLLPFTGVSLALWWHNWYPAKVFVGDTYCYFAGMVFAIVGILGHFSKTLLLLFVPQVLNFLYSSPQLFRVIPCPRHRLPRFNPRSGLLEPSVTSWQHPPSKPVAWVLKLLTTLPLPLIQVRISETGQIVESTNMTILNLWLVWFGPMREDRLAIEILAMQTLIGILGLFVRHELALWVFRQDNRQEIHQERLYAEHIVGNFCLSFILLLLYIGGARQVDVRFSSASQFLRVKKDVDESPHNSVGDIKRASKSIQETLTPGGHNSYAAHVEGLARNIHNMGSITCSVCRLDLDKLMLLWLFHIAA